MTDNTTTDNEIMTIKRFWLDVPATTEGLIGLAAKIPVEVPLEAEIVDVHEFRACPAEAHENPGFEHEPTAMIGFSFEWEAQK